MMLATAFCFVLALTSTLANQDKIDKLTRQITTSVINELVQVAEEAEKTRMSPLEVNNELMKKAADAFKRMGDEIKELAKLSGEDYAAVAKRLSKYITQSKELEKALPKQQQSARFIGAIALGITQIVTDVVKMLLTRY